MKKTKQDPKYLDIPNICFSLTDKEDKRDEKFRKQRLKRGFDESETWCLTTTIANFIIPRLELYDSIADKVFERNSSDKQNIQDLLKSLKLIVRENGGHIFNEKENQMVEKGLEAFSKIFMSLWW